jgi:prepilin-type N-terminal cleavage/methylation domain-containing protein
MSTARGFTLIELLVVVSIIAVLAGLVIALVPQVRLKAKIADTQVRMNSIQQGLSMIGQNEGSTTYKLQQLTERRTTGSPPDPEPGLGGIMTFGAPGSDGLPTIGKRPAPRSSEDNGTWGRRGRGHLALPWGKKFPNSDVPPKMVGPQLFLLRHMSPFNTRKLMKIANILPTKQSDDSWGETQYMTNRKTSEPWNDAWGNPLVIAAVLYQPTHQSATPTPSVPGWKDAMWPATVGSSTAQKRATDPISLGSYVPGDATAARRALLDHLKLYQYNRSVYIAVAAAGNRPWADQADLKSSSATVWANSDTNPTSGLLDDLWSQANWICQQAKNEEFDNDWTELSFDNPRWQGIKTDYLNKTKHQADANRSYYESAYRGNEEHALLSAPQEYK